MNLNEVGQKLQEMVTQATLHGRAHEDDTPEALQLRADLLLRYWEPVVRYFRGIVGDPDAADDLSQQFAQRFMGGDFRRFDPSKGRFRDYLKASLRNMARDYWTGGGRASAPLPESVCLPSAPPDEQSFEVA